MMGILHHYEIEPRLLPILAELAEATGFESVYLTRINWSDHEQLDYSDAVCRYVIEGGPDHTDDVPLVFPQSDMARFLGFQSFVSVPIEVEDGVIYGTLCGASTQRVQISDAQMAEVRRQARLIATLLSGDSAVIQPESNS